jgi:hypothetical protein
MRRPGDQGALEGSGLGARQIIAGIGGLLVGVPWLIIFARSALFDSEFDSAWGRLVAFGAGLVGIAFALVPFVVYLRSVRNPRISLIIGVAMLATTAGLYLRALFSDDTMAPLVLIAAAVCDLILVAAGGVVQSNADDRRRRAKDA